MKTEEEIPKFDSFSDLNILDNGSFKNSCESPITQPQVSISPKPVDQKQPQASVMTGSEQKPYFTRYGREIKPRNLKL